MNLRPARQALRRRCRGMASIAVIILLLVISALLAVNSRTLYQLKREIDMVEQKQLEKFQPPEPAAPPAEDGD